MQFDTVTYIHSKPTHSVACSCDIRYIIGYLICTVLYVLVTMIQTAPFTHFYLAIITSHHHLCAFGAWLSYLMGDCSQQVAMAQAFNNNHNIYYHMDAHWSVGLAWTCFVSPKYLAVQDWVNVTVVFHDTINLMGPSVYHYTKFYEGAVGYTSLLPLNCLVI